MKSDLQRLLKIRQLRLIAAIAEHGQLGRAAAALAITQPAASRMLMEIETAVGAALFERDPKGMAPTPIGELVAQRAAAILLDLDGLSREVEDLKAGNSGKVTVGAVTGAAVGYAIPAIRRLKAMAPRAEIHLNVDNSPALVRDMLEGRNDFVLARLPEHTDSRAFDILPAQTESVRLVVRDGHPLARAKSLSLQDLTDFEWVVQSHRAPMSEAVEAAFLAAGLKPPEKITSTTSLLAVLAILVSSSSITPLASEVSDLLIGADVGCRLKVLPLREPIAMAPYYFLQARGRRLSPLADRLKQLVLETLAAGRR